MVQLQEVRAIAHAVQTQAITARRIIEATLADIEQRNPSLNCFTTITAARALAAADRLDQAVAAGESLGPLGGVPFAVKNLYDIAGEVTLAGSRINQSHASARQDATAIARLESAGAILVGALNMDEYAYGFVTINHHYGVTPNPHAPNRIAGGSSGGSAAAVAAGLVPLTLGSDTNGSIRVPASLCGVYGLKPTYGRLSRAGTYLFSASLDHVGPFARTVSDLAAAYDALQGPDPRDPVCTDRSPETVTAQLSAGISGLRLAIASGHFSQSMAPSVATARDTVAAALSITEQVELPEAARARAAAYLITACEGSQLHLPRLQTRPMDFDPATRDRFLAGALMPQSWYIKAQRFRRWFRDRVRPVFQQVDILIAPTTPCAAPEIEQKTMTIAGATVPIRPHLGIYTQPLSFIGLPVLSVPIHQPGQLPVGVQLIAAPYREAYLFRVAADLEAQGVTTAPIAP